MSLSNLKPAEGSVKRSKRLGRGQGSGKGGTSTRGHKGDKSRSGSTRKIGFEGGQMPLQRRIPKFGFKNINRKEYRILNLDMIQYYLDKGVLKETIKISDLVENKIISKNELFKVLGDGELRSKINLEANKISKKALDVISSLGGTVNIL